MNRWKNNWEWFSYIFEFAFLNIYLFENWQRQEFSIDFPTNVFEFWNYKFIFIYVKIVVTIYSFDCLFRAESKFQNSNVCRKHKKFCASSEIFRSIFKVEFIFNKRSGGSKSFILKKCYFVFTYYFKYKIKLYIVELTNVTHI